MSCIRFSTSAQREQFRDAAPAMPGSDDAATRMRVPEFTASKLVRLRALADHRDPKIRESVASNRHTPADILETLSRDADSGVRSWVARNERVGEGILETLTSDPDEAVRGWVATNPAAPPELVARLNEDTSDVVRGVVSWRLASEAVREAI